MALHNWLFFSQIAGYLFGLVLSFCIIVPMILHEYEFNGYCLLFSKVELSEDKAKLFVKTWSHQAYCNYVLVTGISMNMLCSVQIYRLFKSRHRGTDTSFLSTFFEAITCTILSAAAVSSAIIVTIGFESWCDTISESLISCGDAAGLEVDSYDNINTSGFYIQVNIIQFGTWAVFATCVGLAVLSSLKVCRYHQEESLQEVTLHRERLLTESRSRTYRSISISGRSTPPSVEI